MSDPKDTPISTKANNGDGDEFSDYLDDDNGLKTEGDNVAETDVLQRHVAAKSKSGIGWVAALALFTLSTGLGAFGGFAATQYFSPAPKLTAPVDLAPLRARLDTAESRLSAQAAQVSFLKNEINNRPTSVRVNAVPSGDDNLETTTITTLGNGAENTRAITDLQNQIAQMESALAALRRDIDTGPEGVGPSDQLSALDARRSEDIVPDASTSDTSAPDDRSFDAADYDETIDSLQNDISTLRTRIDGLENALAETRTIASQPTILKEAVLLPAFPRAAVFEALTQPQQTNEAGWISKTLKKHISVRNPEDVKDAEQNLNNIEDAIEAGDITRALSIVEAMPEPAQAQAKNWIAAARRQN